MPKLDATHLTSRLLEQIERLQRGDTLVVRDVKALLTDKQLAVVETAWDVQKRLREGKRPRSDEERAKLGFKEKRELYIDALQAALSAAKTENARALRDKAEKAEVRQARIYLDAYFSARDSGRAADAAKGVANNDLMRAGLKRIDGTARQLSSRRDDQVRSDEDDLVEQTRLEMTEEERLQEQLLTDHLQPSTLKKVKRKDGKGRK